jgi:hypothetical protein
MLIDEEDRTFEDHPSMPLFRRQDHTEGIGSSCSGGKKAVVDAPGETDQFTTVDPIEGQGIHGAAGSTPTGTRNGEGRTASGETSSDRKAVVKHLNGCRQFRSGIRRRQARFIRDVFSPRSCDG